MWWYQVKPRYPFVNTIDEFVGNKLAVQSLNNWLLGWEPSNKKTKCALLSGVNGIGKSLIAELILSKNGFNMINLSIDDERDKEGTDLIPAMLS